MNEWLPHPSSEVIIEYRDVATPRDPNCPSVVGRNGRFRYWSRGVLGRWNNCPEHITTLEEAKAYAIVMWRMS